ncbi:Divergent AAA domain protein [Crateriforma conspicua]|uniref:Divergent AAA domain protein n=1 Tax=Crateriforma conspicua TaxID=2527996 RepID=A0A5C6FWY4_9PLAN|nr:ATP-binding protein [Crateriforma conspicua]TWU66844.1 Divergent AAA domain protein [Crateriforma conspicua]
MDFKSLDAESLIDAIPDAEDSRWELKSASLLEPQNKGDFKKELGKQVSAFANSGGGNIVFGITDGSRALEACPITVGRQPMEDYLSTMVEQSVDYPLRCFQVHRIGFRNNENSAIFVIQIDDSPAAPHQAKGECQYYYRIPGHSKPAPHFHLELLRSRETKCIVDPQVSFVDWDMPWIMLKGRTMSFKFIVLVQNQASFVAMPVGVSLHGQFPESNWTINKESVNDEVDIVMSNEHLFPGLSHSFEVDIQCTVAKDERLSETARRDLDKISLGTRAFSQNFGSKTLHFALSDYVSVEEICEREEANEAEIQEWQAKAHEKMKDKLPQLEALSGEVAEQLERQLRPPNIQLPGMD